MPNQPKSKGDIFDQIAPDKTNGDIFDQIAPDAPGAPPAPNAITSNAAGLSNVPLGSSVGDILSTVGQHLKNMVVGPIKAFTAPPDQNNQQEVNAASNAGQLGVGLYRMTAEPTVNALKQARTATMGHASYDMNGNYTPTKADLYMDALPVVGPWSRNVENDTQKKGVAAGLAGLATDVLAPQAASEGLGAAMQGAGQIARFASATPEAQKLAATRALVPGSPEQLLTRALKPSVANPNFEEQVRESLPSIVKQNPGPGVSGFGKAADAAKSQEQNWYQGLVSKYASTPVDLSPVRQAQIDSVPTIEALEAPGIKSRTSNVASQYTPAPAKTITETSPILDEYGKPITTTKTIPGEPPRTLGLADTLRQESNQKLHSLYEKTGGDRYAALANPETARTYALNNALRDVTYGKLADVSGVPEGTIRQRQNLYGNLNDISNVANKRNVVFGRQNPYSLQESLAMSGGDPLRSPLAFIGQRILKNVTDSDALTNAAVDRAKSPNGPSLTPRESLFSKIPSSAGKVASATGGALRKAPISLNPFFYSSVVPKR